MYIKGGSRRNIGFWAKHLTDRKANDRADLIDKRGLAAENLRDMMREMMQDAQLTRAKNFMYIASFNPTEGETLTERQWERAYEIFEKQRGIPEGQQRIVYEHEKKGRMHRHVVWNRIDTENMRAFPDSLDLKVCEAAKHEIEAELQLQKTPGLLKRDPDLPPPERNPPSWEMFRGQKSGIDPRDVKSEVTAIFRESQNTADFVAGLEAQGYQLCIGDRRDFVLLDSAGETHSLARRLDGVKAAQLRAFMEGYDRAALPSVDQAKEQHRERTAENRAAELSDVQKEIQREATLEKEQAAPGSWQEFINELDAEKQQRDQIAAMGERVTEAMTPGLEADRRKRSEPWDELVSGLAAEEQKNQQQRDQIAAMGERVTGAMTQGLEIDRRERGASWQGFIDGLDAEQKNKDPLQQIPQPEQIEAAKATATNTRPHAEPENRGRTGAAIWLAYTSSNTPQDFVAALEQGGMALAVVTNDEAERSHREAEFAKEIGNRAPRYGAGEIVVVSPGAHVYRLDEKRTGDDRAQVERFLAPLDRSPLQGIEATKQIMHERAAGRVKGPRPTGRHGHEIPTVANDNIGDKILKAPALMGLDLAAGLAHAVADAFSSLLGGGPAVPKTEAQLEEEYRLYENAAAQSHEAAATAAFRHVEREGVSAKQEEQTRIETTADEQHQRLKRGDRER